MVDFEHWCYSVGDDKMQDIIETIEDLDLPYKLKEMILNTIVDAEYEILENMYEGFVSEYQDRCYDEYKDSL
jgi:hypothetical protein